MNTLKRVPELWPAVDTPAAELPAIKDLYASLYGVAYNVEAWEAALRLYQFGKRRDATVSPHLARKWMFLACTECVMQLYHLKERLKAIRADKVRPCISIAGCIDHAGLRRAAKRFDEYFPHIDDLRDAMAHAGEIDGNAQRHALAEGGYGLVGLKEEDRFSAPCHGEIRHVDLTEETLARIEEVVIEFFDAFEPAASMLERQGYLP